MSGPTELVIQGRGGGVAEPGKGYAVTGGQDAVINVFSLSSKREDSNFQLIGHTNNVCALHALADGTIISGSWDQYVLCWFSTAVFKKCLHFT